MKIIVIRHGAVDFRRSRRCTSAGFDRECAAYDQAPLGRSAYVAPQAEFRNIYVSTLPRSRETARLMFPGRDLQESKLISEVPCRSAFDSRIRLPQWLWFLAGRLQWAAGGARQPEKRRDTVNRSRQFIALIFRDGADCAVVTHGFFMHILLWELKKSGFRTDRLRLVDPDPDAVPACRRMGLSGACRQDRKKNEMMPGRSYRIFLAKHATFCLPELYCR